MVISQNRMKMPHLIVAIAAGVVLGGVILTVGYVLLWVALQVFVNTVMT